MSFQKLFRVTGILTFVLAAQLSFAQNTKTVSGTVTDSRDGTPLRGATVSAKGTNAATQTNSEGGFSFDVDNSVTVLVISSVGFATQEVNLQGSGQVNVSLVLVDQSLGEVVLIGYGTARRKDLTGAITTVTTKDFNKGALASPEQLVNGKVAGVQITAPSGAPGAGGRIRVRGTSSLDGSNDPLIVIDNVPVDQTGTIAGSVNPLNLINPNDIESITILKDASATAIYGTRATNGVIMITTKKGRAGNFRLSFNTNNSLSVLGDKVDVLSGEEFRDLIAKEGTANQKTLVGNENTDWQEEVYHSAFTTDNNIAFTGGIKKFPYRAALGYLKSNGVLKTGHMDRVSASINLNPSMLNKSLKIDINLKGSWTNNFFANEGAIGGAAYFDPTQPVMRNDNRFGGYWEWLANNNQPDGLAPKNPVGLLNLRDDESNVARYITNIQFDYTFPFLKELRANLNLGYDYAKGEGTVFVFDSAAMAYTRGGVNNRYENTRKNKLLDFYLNYVKDIRSINSRLDVMAGYGYQDFVRESPNLADYRANGQEFAPAAPFPSFNQNTLISVFGRLNFGIANKYLFTATVRRDGTSRFHPDERWGTFPSAAFAWNIREENFMKTSRTLSALKLRLGYGETGQQEIGSDYQYIPNYFLGEQTAQYQFGTTFYQVNRPKAFDKNLRWESTSTFNVGLDLGFLNGRITTSLDYYNKETEDLLTLVQLPAGTNFSNELFTNIGTMDNDGVEFTFNSTIIKKTKLNWDLGFNVTYNENEITKLTLVDDPTFIGFQRGDISGAVGNKIQINSIGHRPSAFFVKQQVYDNNDRPIEGLYVDRNGDGLINNLDYYHYKSPDPDIMVGFHTSVAYEKWTFSTLIRAQFGNYVYNNVFANGGVFGNSSVNFLNNVHRNYLETGFNNWEYFSDYYVENGSFLRMDNFTVGYDFGSVMNKKANLRGQFSVQNVFLTSKYRGLDPEVSGGIDNNLYPRPRVFSLGFGLDL
jgi:iron complex outermembrane receptor protein